MQKPEGEKKGYIVSHFMYLKIVYAKNVISTIKRQITLDKISATSNRKRANLADI